MGEACTFFGHRDCPDSVRPRLREVLVELIEHHAVDMFYVGQQGAFDGMVRAVLQDLAATYPGVHYAVVLARMPLEREREKGWDFSDTILPEGIETVHPRFAISWRNRWMLKRSDYVVTYIAHAWGGAAQFAKIAQKQKKVTINLYPAEK